jgi:putative FmdB family regulatory protein
MIYEYYCRKCEELSEKVFTAGRQAKTVKCECGARAKRIISGGVLANTGKGSRMGTLCNTLPGDPVYVKNKKHFRDLCKERSEQVGFELYPHGLVGK